VDLEKKRRKGESLMEFKWDGRKVKVEVDKYMLFGKEIQDCYLNIDGIIIGKDDILFGTLEHFIEVRDKGYKLKEYKDKHNQKRNFLIYEEKVADRN